MPRVIEVTVPSDQTAELVETLTGREEVIGLRVQKGVSVKPPGDVIVISTTNRSLHSLARVLDKFGIGSSSGTSFTNSGPIALVSPTAKKELLNDKTEGTWEEIETTISDESNATANTMGIMLVAGALAAVGLATNALHLVIGAMLIAPGFEPLLRISLGVSTGTSNWRRGLIQSGKVYLALLVGALATSIFLRVIDKPLLGEQAGYLPAHSLVSYWTTISASSVLITTVASIAGALVVAANRSVLTAGVMVALALVPSATLVVMGIVAGDLEVASRGAMRWAIEVILVITMSGLVFGWKQWNLHQRHSNL